MAVKLNSFEHRNPFKLKNHKLNAEIYGDVADDDFVKSCERGIEVPLMILADDTIIAGHRRMQAARKLKMKDVPVIVRRDLVDPLDIEWAFIISNKSREKTPAQLSKEAAKLFEIEEKRAAARKSSTQAKPGEKAAQGGGTSSTTLAPEENEDLGKTRDIVGAALGVSGKTAEKLADIGEKLEELEEKGHTNKAAELEQKVNEEGVAAAHREIVADENPEAKALKDGDGFPVPKNLHSAFALAKNLRGYSASVGKVLSGLEACLDQSGGERLPMSEIKADCKNLQSAIKAAIPYAVCPYCKGRGCNKCQTWGWLTYDQFSGIPKERRQQK